MQWWDQSEQLRAVLGGIEEVEGAFEGAVEVVVGTIVGAFEEVEVPSKQFMVQLWVYYNSFSNSFSITL